MSPLDYQAPPVPATAASPLLLGATVARLLHATAARDPSRPAVVDPPRRLTYGELTEAVRRFAGALAEAGFVPGDVLALFLPNCWEFVVAHLGAAWAGVVTMTLHTPYREQELRTLLGHVHARGLVMPHRSGTRDIAAVLDGVRRELPRLETVWVVRPEGPVPGTREFEADLERAHAAAPAAVRPDDPFALIFTSGTQSLVPKGCIHTHDALLSNAWWTAQDAPMDADDAILSASPFTHMFGLGTIHMALATGARQVILPRFDPETFLARAEAEGVTMAFGVPAQLFDAAARQERVHARLALKEVRTGGVAVPRRLVEVVGASLGCPLVTQWGMSEIGAGAYTRRSDPPSVAWETVGRPTWGTRFRIVDETGRPVEAGVVGDLEVLGPSLFRGYLDNPAETARAFTADGWFRTGDMGFLDEAGRLHFAGRRKDLINRGGMKVSALEVEEYLREMPQIRDAAVVGYPDPRLGERVLAAVELQAGERLDLAAVTAHLDARGVAKYKWPERLEVVAELPRTPTGKLAKERIRRLLDALGGDETAPVAEGAERPR